MISFIFTARNGITILLVYAPSANKATHNEEDGIRFDLVKIILFIVCLTVLY